MIRFNKQISKIAFLGLGLSLCLTGCDYSFFMNQEQTGSASVSVSEEAQADSYTYTNNYQDIEIVLPSDWTVSDDKAAKLTVTSSAGSSLSIQRKTGKAALSVLPFPEKEEDLPEFLNNQPAYTAQVILLQGDSYKENEMNGSTVSDFEYLDIPFDDDHTASFYQFRVMLSDGSIQHYIGVKMDELAYTFTILANPGEEEDITPLIDLLDQLEFVNQPEITAAYLNGMDDLEVIDVKKMEDEQNTKTCVSAVNVRTAPNAGSSQVIGSLNAGDKIVVEEEEGNWYKFDYDGKTGYAYKDYFE